MLDVARSLLEDPEELRAFAALLLTEVKSQAVLIEKARHQLAEYRAYLYGTSSKSIEQLQLALETSEIATASLAARLQPPDDTRKDQPMRRPIPDYIPR